MPARGPAKNHTGLRYGRLVVLGSTERTVKGNVWLCRCDCGKEITLLTGALTRTSKATKSCGCLVRDIRQATTLPDRGCKRNRLWAEYQKGARDRGLTFSLSRLEFELFLACPCVYCGEPSGDRFTGIDRIDNAIGYEPGNCVSCCKVCNVAKSTMSLRAFLTWLRKAGQVSASSLILKDLLGKIKD